MKKKIAVVSGSTGQDGSYLCRFLLKKKYKVIALIRPNSKIWRHKYLNINNRVTYEKFDLTKPLLISKIIKKYKPDEFYNLAAYSYVNTSFLVPRQTLDYNATGVLNILNCIKDISPKTKFYQASSSEMFGNANKKKMNIKSGFNPKSPYASSKLFAHNLVSNYRDYHNIFSVSGILFNHESPLRENKFVTKKVVNALVKYKMNRTNYKKVSLGNIESQRDWGYANEFIEAMWLMLQQNNPTDHIVGTGKTISVKKFINLCLKNLLLNHELHWKGKGINEKLVNRSGQIIFDIDEGLYRPTEVNKISCDNSYTFKSLKWKPKIMVNDLSKIMLNEEAIIIKNKSLLKK